MVEGCHTPWWWRRRCLRASLRAPSSRHTCRPAGEWSLPGSCGSERTIQRYLSLWPLGPRGAEMLFAREGPFSTPLLGSRGVLDRSAPQLLEYIKKRPDASEPHHRSGRTSRQTTSRREPPLPPARSPPLPSSAESEISESRPVSGGFAPRRAAYRNPELPSIVVRPRSSSQRETVHVAFQLD